MDVDTLRKLFRSMEKMSIDDELEDQLLTDDERDSLRFRESVCTDQWAKIVADHHNASAENGMAAGWFPVEIASLLFAAQFCDDTSFSQELWDFAQKGPFSKWDLRSRWYIAEVLSPGVDPPTKGWID